MDTRHLKIGALAIAVAALCACSSLPERVATLEQARSDVRTLERDPLANQVAGTELSAARDAIGQADRAVEEKEPLEVVEHDAYLAQRYADISKQRIEEAHAKQQIADAQSQRDRVLLESRTREAEAAEQRGREAQAQSEAAAEQARAAEQSLRQQAQSAQARNEALEQQARDAEQRNSQLERELEGLKAEQTDRGLMMTLGDVLFDTNQATLKPGANLMLDRLAAFMRDFPNRQLLIEGHTDARGSDEYNRDLSKRRADAVRDALMARDIDGQRVRAVGLGETYPVASNDTAAGMQQNRRVEIVISDEKGAFPDGAERIASSGS